MNDYYTSFFLFFIFHPQMVWGIYDYGLGILGTPQQYNVSSYRSSCWNSIGNSILPNYYNND